MSEMERLTEIMALLRDPEKGCPWDCKQTMQTIVPHTIEEVYEVADAIESDDMLALKEELGDLLLQVVFYSQIAKEEGKFDIDGVINAICEKLVRRHPHVFGEMVVESVAEQNALWESLKQQEREQKETNEADGALAGVIQGLPALMRAYKLQKRAASTGFDWPDVNGALEKVREETAEVEEAAASNIGLEEEIGDLLFAMVNVSRKLGIDPEMALRKGNQKFERRFAYMEQASGGEKVFAQLSLGQMEQLWQQAKSK